MNKLALELLKRPSISPSDAGCQALLAEALSHLGFTTRSLNYEDVTNLWAKHGNQKKTLLFIGHTDVVPPGPLEAWTFPPFEPTLANGKCYARGTADMKVAIACMVDACERFLTSVQQPHFNLAFLMTSCEEADTVHGTEKALHQLIELEHETVDWCLVGEPSSEKTLSDIIKIGRRGSLNGYLTIKGKQGHIAYPHLADNPIHRFSGFLNEITHIEWDKGTDDFDPTSFQISNIQSGTGAANVIPGDISLMFNFRYAPSNDAESLKQAVEILLKKYELSYSLQWNHSAKPFISLPGQLHDALQNAITGIMGKPAKTSTTGGTSDGRFIAAYGIETIECGFVNKTIHQINEHIDVADIEKLTQIYFHTLLYLHNKA